jgi:hypothetical protein
MAPSPSQSSAACCSGDRLGRKSEQKTPRFEKIEGGLPISRQKMM